MARPKRQDQRRAELIEAAQRAVIRYGPEGAILNRIAEEAGVAAPTVLYYYPDSSELVLDAIRRAMDRFYTRRSSVIEEFDGTTPERLRELITLGLPDGPDDPEVRMLCELGGASARLPTVAALLSTLFDREVSMYRILFERGAAEGSFTLTASSEEIAQNIVSLEDAYGYRVVGRHPSLTRDAAERLIVGYARSATGHELPGAVT